MWYEPRAWVTRVEFGLIVEHLGERDLGLDDLLFAAGLHAGDAAAAGIEIAHDVARDLLRAKDLDVHYRFEERGLDAFHSGAKGLAAGGAE